MEIQKTKWAKNRRHYYSEIKKNPPDLYCCMMYTSSILATKTEKYLYGSREKKKEGKVK